MATGEEVTAICESDSGCETVGVTSNKLGSDRGDSASVVVQVSQSGVANSRLEELELGQPASVHSLTVRCDSAFAKNSVALGEVDGQLGVLGVGDGRRSSGRSLVVDSAAIEGVLATANEREGASFVQLCGTFEGSQNCRVADDGCRRSHRVRGGNLDVGTSSEVGGAGSQHVGVSVDNLHIVGVQDSLGRSLEQEVTRSSQHRCCEEHLHTVGQTVGDTGDFSVLVGTSQDERRGVQEGAVEHTEHEGAGRVLQRTGKVLGVNTMATATDVLNQVRSLTVDCNRQVVSGSSVADSGRLNTVSGNRNVDSASRQRSHELGTTSGHNSVEH